MSTTRKGPARPPFERGVVVVSLDTEQIWGYMDHTTPAEYLARFPRAGQTAARLLDLFVAHGVSATWTVVGGLSLTGSQGAADERMAGLPKEWLARIRPGNELSEPAWYARSLVTRIRDAAVSQEIGLHGGLTHLPWSRPAQPVEVLRRELAGGIRALHEIGVRPVSFTFPRNFEARTEVLAEFGFRCFRGPGVGSSDSTNRTLYGSVSRIAAEWRLAAPAVFVPAEQPEGLWNIPSSLFLFRMAGVRALVAPLPTRRLRVRRGIEAAIKSRAVFHLWLHPDNLAESGAAFGVFEGIVREIDDYRRRGDIEVLTMAEVANRMDASARATSPGRAAARSHQVAASGR